MYVLCHCMKRVCSSTLRCVSGGDKRRRKSGQRNQPKAAGGSQLFHRQTSRELALGRAPPPRRRANLKRRLTTRRRGASYKGFVQKGFARLVVTRDAPWHAERRAGRLRLAVERLSPHPTPPRPIGIDRAWFRHGYEEGEQGAGLRPPASWHVATSSCCRRRSPRPLWRLLSC